MKNVLLAGILCLIQQSLEKFTSISDLIHIESIHFYYLSFISIYPTIQPNPVNAAPVYIISDLPTGSQLHFTALIIHLISLFLLVIQINSLFPKE